MEYTSDIKPKLRDCADYELTVTYLYHLKYSLEDLSAEELFSYVIKSVNSCRPMFCIVDVKSEMCLNKTENTHRFSCVIGLSADLPSNNAVPYILKLTDCLYSVIRQCWLCRLELHCMNTNCHVLLLDEKSNYDYICSADVTTLKWSIINDTYKKLLDHMTLKEKAMIFCRLLKIIENKKCLLREPTLCGISEPFAAKYLSRKIGYIDISSCGNTISYCDSDRHFRNPDSDIECVVCVMNGVSLHTREPVWFVILFAGTQCSIMCGDKVREVDIKMFGKIVEVPVNIYDAAGDIFNMTGLLKKTISRCITQTIKDMKKFDWTAFIKI